MNSMECCFDREKSLGSASEISDLNRTSAILAYGNAYLVDADLFSFFV